MLRISRELYEHVVAHCQSRYPKEACGILAGRARGDELTVTQAYPMTNVEDSPIGYAMDPKEQLQAEKQMRQRQQRMVAVYHSHMAKAAYPSPVDVQLSISPDVAYVLVSLKDRGRPEFKSYRIAGETIAPEAVQLEDVEPERTAA